MNHRPSVRMTGWKKDIHQATGKGFLEIHFKISDIFALGTRLKEKRVELVKQRIRVDSKDFSIIHKSRI